VVDQQLRAAVEQLGERLRTFLGVETVLLLDPNPGQLAPLAGELVTQARVFLLACEQLLAFRSCDQSWRFSPPGSRRRPDLVHAPEAVQSARMGEQAW
jgi:hypothetical protein